MPVGILSGYAPKRQAVRDTWGKDACVYFIVGKKDGAWPEDEATHHGDLLLLDMDEVYHGITSILPYKTVLRLLVLVVLVKLALEPHHRPSIEMEVIGSVILEILGLAVQSRADRGVQGTILCGKKSKLGHTLDQSIVKGVLCSQKEGFLEAEIILQINRPLDIEQDKSFFVDHTSRKKSANPFVGLRMIVFCHNPASETFTAVSLAPIAASMSTAFPIYPGSPRTIYGTIRTPFLVTAKTSSVGRAPPLDPWNTRGTTLATALGAILAPIGMIAQFFPLPPALLVATDAVFLRYFPTPTLTKRPTLPPAFSVETDAVFLCPSPTPTLTKRPNLDPPPTIRVKLTCAPPAMVVVSAVLATGSMINTLVLFRGIA
jgi:hypothetical protein